MTIHLREHEYVLGIWILEHDLGNILSIVVKRNDDWVMQIRRRTYVDEKIFESADPREFYTCKLRGSPTEQEAIETVRHIFQSATRIYHPVQPIREALVQSADFDILVRAMDSMPGLHTQKHTIQ